MFSHSIQGRSGHTKKAGFKREGILRDAVKDGDRYADDVLMAILEDEWRQLHQMHNR